MDKPMTEPPTEDEENEVISKIDAGEEFTARDLEVADWMVGWSAMDGEYTHD